MYAAKRSGVFFATESQARALIRWGSTQPGRCMARRSKEFYSARADLHSRSDLLFGSVSGRVPDDHPAAASVWALPDYAVVLLRHLGAVVGSGAQA